MRNLDDFCASSNGRVKSGESWFVWQAQTSRNFFENCTFEAWRNLPPQKLLYEPKKYLGLFSKSWELCVKNEENFSKMYVNVKKKWKKE